MATRSNSVALEFLMAETNNLHFNQEFDALKAKASNLFSFWPRFRCGRCHSVQILPRPRCSSCGAVKVETLKAIYEGSGAPFGVHKVNGTLAELENLVPPVNLSLQNRSRAILSQVSAHCDRTRWSLYIDERSCLAAGQLEEISSAAGSERRFHLRHPWFLLKGQGLTISLIQGFEILCIKRFHYPKVEVNQHASPRYELLIEKQVEGSPLCLSVQEAKTEAEIVSKLLICLESPGALWVDDLDQSTFPKTLARAPSPKELLVGLRKVAAVVVATALLSNLLLGPVRQHLELYRLSHSLGGGPKLLHVKRLAKLSQIRSQTPSLEGALGNVDPWQRFNALLALRYMNHPHKSKIAQPLVQDISPFVRHEALQILIKDKQWEALKKLVSATGRIDVKLTAVRILADLKDPSLGPLFIQLLEDKSLDTEFRAELLCALPRLYPVGNPKLFSIIETLLCCPNTPAELRHAATLCHTECGGPRGVIVVSLTKLIKHLSRDPASSKAERMVIRASAHSLRGSSVSEHKEILKELKQQPWITAELARIVDRSLRQHGS
jgi:hypothetical protein